MRSKLAIAFLIVGVLSIGAWNSQSQTEVVKNVKYEYLVIPDPTESASLDEGMKRLNELGAAGWELAGTTKSGGYGSARLYFKRAKKSF